MRTAAISTIIDTDVYGIIIVFYSNVKNAKRQHANMTTRQTGAARPPPIAASLLLPK
jgi:hypothetical protein